MAEHPHTPLPATKLAQAYQVIGELLHLLGAFESDAGQRALDYFADANTFNEGFLPWPSPSETQELASGRLKAWEDHRRADQGRAVVGGWAVSVESQPGAGMAAGDSCRSSIVMIDLPGFRVDEASRTTLNSPTNLSEVIKISPEQIEAGADVLYHALPEAFPWRSSDIGELAREVFLAMVGCAGGAEHDRADGIKP
jgi:hypothetical protein